MFERLSQRIMEKPRSLLFAFAVILLIVGMANYAILVQSQARIIEHEAIRIAEVAARQADASRTAYTMEVVNKLKSDGFEPRADYAAHRGAVPLPAQFLKLVGRESAKSGGLYSYAPLSKWNLEPTQGLKDDFQRWAWGELEKQDLAEPHAPIDWKPVWRFEEKGGVRMLRYLRADPASGTSCVNCHNALERSPQTHVLRAAAGIAPDKQWKQHQLLGAIEVNIPVDKIESIAASQARTSLAGALFLFMCAFSFIGWMAMRDMQRKQRAVDYLEGQTKIDALTGLGNRTLFNERGKVTLANARKTGKQVGVLFIDLDYFKEINDTYGHDAGDRVLSEVGKRFTACLRETDLIARQGGDEFLVLLEGGPHRLDFSSIAQKLLDVLASGIEFNGKQLHVGASIGVSFYPDHGVDLRHLVKRADTAMYNAKRQGRNAYCIWHEGLIQ